MKIALLVLTLVSPLWTQIAAGAVDLIKLRDSTDEKPAFGAVEFSYLTKNPRKKTDSQGNIQLPKPHDKADPITVCPDEQIKYGPCFRQHFPKDDGFIWLMTQTGALTMEKSVKQLEKEEKLKPAAALLALVSDFFKELDPPKSKELLQLAFRFLARNYHAEPIATVVPSGKLRRAVSEDKGVVLKPGAEGAWDSLDFLNIAGITRTEAYKLAGLLRAK